MFVELSRDPALEYAYPFGASAGVKFEWDPLEHLYVEISILEVNSGVAQNPFLLLKKKEGRTRLCPSNSALSAAATCWQGCQ